MKKLLLSTMIALSSGLVSISSFAATEECKVSMMGRICYNADGSLRGESNPVEKKGSEKNAADAKDAK